MVVVTDDKKQAPRGFRSRLKQWLKYIIPPRARAFLRRCKHRAWDCAWPTAFSQYFQLWKDRISGRLALRLRRELCKSPKPNDPDPSHLRIFHGLYSTVQPRLLQQSMQEQGATAQYETYDNNPAFPAPDVVYPVIHHPDFYFEHVAVDEEVLLPYAIRRVHPNSIEQLIEHFQSIRDQYDVFHFNWFLSFLPDNVDVEHLRQDGRAVYFHFRGCFILSKLLTDQFTRQGKSIEDACAHCKAKGWREEYFSRFHRAVSRASRVLVSTPNLCHCSPDFEYVPLSLDPELKRIPLPLRDGHPKSRTVEVLHCVSGPGHYAVKGTEHIQRAVAALQREGLPVELTIIEKLPRKEAIERMATGDIMVEQLNLGAYGNVALEAMAQGLPVISSLHPTVAHLVPGCPIVHADPTTITERLRELVTQPRRRQEIGEQSYQWARSFHDNDQIASHLMHLYRVDLGLEERTSPNTIENRSPSYGQS